ncbi:hypothetical protein D3C78_1643290 [compost metagenome]
MVDLVERCKEHFGEDFQLEHAEIEAEYIHTSCLGYDLYDAGDWTRYIHITYTKPEVVNENAG